MVTYMYVTDIVPTSTLNYSALVESGCECGCQMSSPSGTIIGSPDCRNYSVWIIRAGEGQTIQLSFVGPTSNLDSNPSSGLYVRIRDGDTPMANLLVDSSNFWTPSSVFSTGSRITVELMVSDNSSEGFIAIYSFVQGAPSFLI